MKVPTCKTDDSVDDSVELRDALDIFAFRLNTIDRDFDFAIDALDLIEIFVSIVN